MPRPVKTARLWLRPESQGRAAAWVIKDGERRVSTGCAVDDRTGAEQALAAYVAEKYTPESKRGRHSSEIPIADAMVLYLRDVAPGVKRPNEMKRRFRALREFWGDKTLAQITGSSCRAYAAKRGAQTAARRELEDLRAAIRYYHREGFCDSIPAITLPPRSEPRLRWLTRSEAARLLWAAWRYRTTGGATPGRHTRRHVARFILVGLYTGTRAGAICGASFVPAIGRGYVDLERGVFYRRGLGTAETKKRQPAVGLPPRLVAHMRRWRANGQTSVIEYNGKPLLRISDGFERVAAAAKLPGVSPHHLRHTAASWAMQKGAPVALIADYLGMTVEVLLSTYGHLHPDHHGPVGRAITGKGR